MWRLLAMGAVGLGCRTVTEDLWELFHALGGKFDKRHLRIPDARSAIDRTLAP